MIRALILILAAMFLSTPLAEAKRRMPANKLPTRAYTFTCRDENGDADNVIALVRVSLDLDDQTSGLASATALIRDGKSFRSHAMNGRYTAVPNGFLLNMRQGFGSQFEFHLHPAEASTVPNLQKKQICQITGEMESL